MAEFNLKIIKLFFVVVIAMLILAMTSGMNILRGAKFSGWEKLKMEMNFWKYKRALAVGDNILSENSKYAQSVPVLMYHGIITNPDWKGDDTNISLEGFRDQMFALKKEGYQSITLADFNDFMKNGKKIPEKSFLITFDDGRRDSYYPADPILRALGFNAVMFAITGQSSESGSQKGDFYLTWDEFKEMQANGRWEIESHGDFDHDWEKISESGEKGHFLSNRIWLSAPKNRLETEDEAKKRILNDLFSAKSKIEKNLGGKTIAFAYPFNDYGQEQQNFPEAGQFLRENIGKIYPLTFMQVDNDDPVANYSDPNQLFIKRIDVNASISTAELLSILSHNEDKRLPYRDTFWDDQGWVSRWGKERIWGDLTISEEEPGSGNLTILLGASLWQNYTMKSRVKIIDGNSVSQVIRFKDEDNYAWCDFGGSGIAISEKIGGQENILAEKSAYFSLPLHSEAQVETSVVGKDIKCFLNGNLELQGKMNSASDSGGVGFYIWDDMPKNAAVGIENVEVSPI